MSVERRRSEGSPEKTGKVSLSPGDDLNDGSSSVMGCKCCPGRSGGDEGGHRTLREAAVDGQRHPREGREVQRSSTIRVRTCLLPPFRGVTVGSQPPSLLGGPEVRESRGPRQRDVGDTFWTGPPGEQDTCSRASAPSGTTEDPEAVTGLPRSQHQAFLADGAGSAVELLQSAGAAGADQCRDGTQDQWQVEIHVCELTFPANTRAKNSPHEKMQVRVTFEVTDTEYVLRGRASSLHVDEQLDCAGLGGTELQAGLCPAGLSSDGTGRGQTPGDIAFGMKRLGLAEGLRACLPCPALLPTVQPAIGTFLSRKIPEPTLLTGSPGYLCYQTLSGSDPGICAGWEERKGRLGGMDRAIEEVHNRRSELSARFTAGRGADTWPGCLAAQRPEENSAPSKALPPPSPRQTRPPPSRQNEKGNVSGNVSGNVTEQSLETSSGISCEEAICGTRPRRRGPGGRGDVDSPVALPSFWPSARMTGRESGFSSWRHPLVARQQSSPPPRQKAAGILGRGWHTKKERAHKGAVSRPQKALPALLGNRRGELRNCRNRPGI
uniref:Uncharacterized protein n=1 Tax=Rangifer tarandus platyrhynchus TaxID=3082113 RepID=A0ACB0FGA7_RANTA|nr:unnamed protein product [Rangifer tarandus platyrhynchus]